MRLSLTLPPPLCTMKTSLPRTDSSTSTLVSPTANLDSLGIVSHGHVVAGAVSYQPLCWGDAEVVAYLLCATVRRAGTGRAEELYG